MPVSRRGLLAAGLATFGLPAACRGAAASTSVHPSDAEPVAAPGGFLLGLNTSTIRGQKLPIIEEIALAAKAGFQGMEPWLDELRHYRESGGSLQDLAKRFRDAGIRVESAIDFFEWAVDDDARRARGLEEARRSMEIVRAVGGTRIAAPPSGATDHAVDPLRLAERYRRLLEIGDQIGVVAQAEVWGFSKSLSRLGEAAEVAIEAAHPRACILPDVFHLYKGGSSLEGLRLLSPSAIHVFHVNDYPAQPPRATITDADRVFPGDGVAPYARLLRDLRDGGFRVMLSLELFNRQYWKDDPLTVLHTGAAKIRALIEASERAGS